MLDKEIGLDVPDCGFEDHPVIEEDGCNCDDDDDDFEGCDWDDDDDDSDYEGADA
jgi:hypothetical protein